MKFTLISMIAFVALFGTAALAQTEKPTVEFVCEMATSLKCKGACDGSIPDWITSELVGNYVLTKNEKKKGYCADKLEISIGPLPLYESALPREVKTAVRRKRSLPDGWTQEMVDAILATEYLKIGWNKLDVRSINRDPVLVKFRGDSQQQEMARADHKGLEIIQRCDASTLRMGFDISLGKNGEGVATKDGKVYLGMAADFAISNGREEDKLKVERVNSDPNSIRIETASGNQRHGYRKSKCLYRKI